MKINRKIIFSLAASALLTLIIGGGWLTLHTEIQQIRENQIRYNRSLGDEIETQQSTLKKIGLNQSILFDKLNESREALELPQAEAVTLQSDTPADSASSEGAGGPNNDDALFYDGINYLDSYYQSKAAKKSFAMYLENRNLRDTLKSMELEFQEIHDQRYTLLHEDKRLFVLDAGAEQSNPQLTITSRLQAEEHFNLDGGEQTVDQSLQFIRNEFDRMQQHIQAFRQKVDFCEQLTSDSEFSQLRAEKNLKIITPSEQTSSGIDIALKRIEWRIRQAGSNGNEGGWISSYGVHFQSGTFFLNDETFSSRSEFKSALLQNTGEIDDRSPREVVTAGAIQRIQTVSEEPAFQTFLSENGLRMNKQPRENGDYFYFDLRDENGERYGAFAVLKKHGKIYLTDREDVVISELKTIGTKVHFSRESADSIFGSGSDSNTVLNSLPEPASISKAGNSRESMILLCGTHEKNADTMMIARLSEDDGIRLISIPRDIYYKQRKISSYYRLYGIDKLRSVIEEITGVQFDGHITVDMYAFIDVVNILGGIDVHLEKALIDPTYKIREHGEWKTLFFEAGTHHLNGIEALRIARSRHTSNDFERAYRQQLVIKALFTKMNSLHAGKLQEVYKLFKVLYQYVDTDFSTYDLAQFFLKYHSAELVPKKSLSTDNILYNTYSNYYLSGLTEEEVDDDFYKGAWILLPKENDWGLIPRYVYQQLYLE
ncbi:MAG: LCP family protein [Spirochaetia bacterium]